MLTASKEDIARVMSKVDILPNGCWFWMGGRTKGQGNKKPCGSFSLKGKTVRAHRFSSEILNGHECPPGHHRDHTCDWSLCVNPAHIEVVTHEENQRRKMMGRGAMWQAPKCSCTKRHPLIGQCFYLDANRHLKRHVVEVTKIGIVNRYFHTRHARWEYDFIDHSLLRLLEGCGGIKWSN